jgi:hypothetical protein
MVTMLAHFLFFLAAVSFAFLFTGFGAFFLYYVWLYYRDGSRTPRALTLVEYMASDLDRQASKLDGLRLQMFLDWLQRHSRGLQAKCIRKNESNIQVLLKLWLETFQPDDLHSEYQLLMSEITWWRDADEKTLLRCVSQEFLERYSSR